MAHVWELARLEVGGDRNLLQGRIDALLTQIFDDELRKRCLFKRIAACPNQPSLEIDDLVSRDRVNQRLHDLVARRHRPASSLNANRPHREATPRTRLRFNQYAAISRLERSRLRPWLVWDAVGQALQIPSSGF